MMAHHIYYKFISDDGSEGDSGGSYDKHHSHYPFSGRYDVDGLLNEMKSITHRRDEAETTDKMNELTHSLRWINSIMKEMIIKKYKTVVIESD